MQDGLKGDRSEAFAFVAFFPEPIQPYLKPLSRAIFKFFRSVRLIPSPEGEDLEAANSVLESNRESERRRLLALKTLETRFTELK